MLTTQQMRSICLDMIREYDQCDDEYEIACFALSRLLSRTQYDQLEQLISDGPVWDGDVMSKSARDDLLDFGLASRACVKGKQGFTVANYVGWDVYNS